MFGVQAPEAPRRRPGGGVLCSSFHAHRLDGMAMGKKPAARQPSPMWVTTADLPTSAGHPFFERLNRVLEEAGFDAFVEGLCAVFYASRLGRPSLRPGRYFRLLFIGYFEGLSSERGIAWRVADSLSLRAFLDLDVTEAPPNHSTLSRTRRLIDVETHVAVFTWVWNGWRERVWCRGRRSASMRRRWKRTRRCGASSGAGWRERVRGMRRRTRRSSGVPGRRGVRASAGEGIGD